MNSWNDHWMVGVMTAIAVLTCMYTCGMYQRIDDNFSCTLDHLLFPILNDVTYSATSMKYYVISRKQAQYRQKGGEMKMRPAALRVIIICRL
jgi:hypothetical protein